MKYSIFFLLSLLAFSACQNEADPTEEAAQAETATSTTISLTPDQMQQANVELGQPQERAIGSYISCSGQIDVPPAGRHAIHSPVMGFVGNIKHLPGQYVERGTPLTSIHHPDLIRLQRDFLETAARLPFLEKDKARKAELAESDAASQKAFETIASELAVAQSRLSGLRAELELIGIDVDELEQSQTLQKRIYLYAPVSGYLAAIPAQPGQLVQPDAPLFRMIDRSHLHLELEVYAKDLPKVKKGQPVRIQQAGSEQEMRGQVHLIGQSVDLERKTARVHVHFDEPPTQLAVGTFLFAHIQVDSRQTTVVPASAIVRSGESAYVFQQTDKGFERVPVQLGQQEGEYYELKDSDMPLKGPIALKGAYYINGTE
ncbi:MAG: efflux RND transporter periplasmic adaptor subunit [Bacteroidetes bacterium]|jgi:cobalt-zinc-cadmium efflux system membrane fusion protein|nr:efflux RND transporter periplasmic adaptor subunit [Bacteroidota bacterium]